MPRSVRIANCSGFYGDRLAAAREMLADPIDVLTGDYLAELTMLILWKARRKDPSLGYDTTSTRGCRWRDANVGLWAVSPRAYAWLRRYLTIDLFRALLTEASGLEIDRYELPNLLALNFVVHGLLAPDVSATTRPDAQAKGLGEYLRSRVVTVPADLIRP